jgi:FecR protein
MSSRREREGDLRRVLREVRALPPADIDWARVEEGLLREARRSPRVAPRSPYPLAWAALALVAAVALWLVGERSGNAPPQGSPAVIEATAPLRANGAALTLGTRLQAGERELAVAHGGRVTWTLAPNSAAVLMEKEQRVVVRLERGSVLSEVTPSSKAESFVVEAAGTRVAVHGTVFRVELDEEGRVIVQVREGTVAVGPLGSVPAFFLKAPAHGDFAPDGRSGSIDGRPLGDSEERRAEPLRLGPARSAGRAAPSAPSSTFAVPSAPLPIEPSIRDIEVGVANIVDVTSQCFSQNTQSDEGVQITVRTAASLTITGSGAVSDVDFQPPLAPEVEACAADGIVDVTFAPSQLGAKVTRMLELKR